MVNFGPLTAEIRLWVWGTPSKLKRVLRFGSINARHSSSGRQPNFAALNRGQHLHSAGRPSRWALAHILVKAFLRVCGLYSIVIKSIFGCFNWVNLFILLLIVVRPNIVHAQQVCCSWSLSWFVLIGKFAEVCLSIKHGVHLDSWKKAVVASTLSDLLQKCMYFFTFFKPS